MTWLTHIKTKSNSLLHYAILCRKIRKILHELNVAVNYGVEYHYHLKKKKEENIVTIQTSSLSEMKYNLSENS